MCARSEEPSSDNIAPSTVLRICDAVVHFPPLARHGDLSGNDFTGG